MNRRRYGLWVGLAALALLTSSACSDRAAEDLYEHGNAQCSDSQDNDEDQLIDCDDPGCDGTDVCGSGGDGSSLPSTDAGAADGSTPADGAVLPPPPPPPPPGQHVHYFVAGGETADVDLLFLVDNSGSMAEEQENLRKNFPKLIDALKSASLGGDLPNLHVGVVTSDLGAGSYALPSCEVTSGDKGKLQATPRVAGCTPPTDSWISYVGGKTNVPGNPSTDAVQQVKDAFSCIAKVGTNGCGFEQTLEAVRWFLDPAKNQNPGFLRSSSVLAVVLITDEDDCSAKKAQLYDPTHMALTDPLGPLTSFRCFEFGVTCDVNDRNKLGPRKHCVPSGDWLWDVKQRYVDFLFGLKSPGRIVVAAIAGPTDRIEVGKDGNNPVLKASCQSSQGMAVPAIRIKALVDGIGAGGYFSPICTSDFGPALEEVADRINAARGLNCLRPLDDTSPSPGLQPACEVELQVGGKLTKIPPCSAAAGCMPCPCWRVKAKAECKTGHALEVQQADTPPEGALIKASCKAISTP